MPSIYDELVDLGQLRHCGIALVEYSMALSEMSLRLAGRRWVARPDNFVTFTVQTARNRDIVATLRGHPFEFETHEELKLKHDRGGYSRFNFSKPAQLYAATAQIRRAFELYR
jgi:hypothetical protein